MFINEAKLLRIVKHKNIINLESLYIHKKELIQVLEYASGGTLLQLLKEVISCLFQSTGMQRVEKWKIMRDLIMGLEHLRTKRIVHRDLKL
jgi:serine/threonine protein kinase